MCGVPIRISEQVNTPLTWGIRRSIILLPAAMLPGDPAVPNTAIRHEQAHIARWDWMWSLLAEVVCALCWFQPGAWWLRRRMRLESERACDDLVLLSGMAGPDYAGHLLLIVRSAVTHEVAPAMAQSGGMEKRMQHILDTKRPRRANRTWLAVSAPFALALLSLAALRVSARPVEAKVPTGHGATTTTSNGSSSLRSNAADPATKPGAADRAGGSQLNSAPAATLSDASPTVALDKVVWGKAVDGLEPGFLLTTPGVANKGHVPFNSRVEYKVLVRNVTDRDCGFTFRRGTSNPWDYDPYLIPNDEFRAVLSSPTLPQRFRAMGVSDLSVACPSFYVKLAPGESVVIPDELRLTIGDADQQSFPRVESIKKGMNWIVQPLMVHRLTAAEAEGAESARKTPYSEKRVATILDRAGQTEPRAVPLFGTRSDGKQLLARVQLEVGTNRDWTLTGHSNSVEAEVFSPDSKHLVTGSADGTAIVWDVTTGKILLTLKGSTAAISSTIYTPNGKFVLTGCTDGAIHIWDATTGEKLRTLASPGGRVCSLDISSDGATILGGYEDGKVKIWSTSAGQSPVATFAYDNRLISAAISPDGKSIAAGYSDSTLKVWDLPTRQALISEKIEHSQGMLAVHFDTQGTLYTWDREETEDPDKTHNGKIKINAMIMWDVRPRRILGEITFALPPGAIRHIVSYSNFVSLFGLSQGQVVLNNMHDGPVTLDAHEGPVAAIAISPDGVFGATGGKRNGNGEAKIWDMQAHKPSSQVK